MSTIGVSLLGNFKDKGKTFGKLGTKSDIGIYHGKYGDNECFFVEPIGYPEKLQPLIYSINMCDYHILFVSEIDEQIGETILLLKYLNKKCFVILEKDWIEEEFKSLANAIDLDFDILNIEQIKESLFSLKNNINKLEGKGVIIDHYFPVKGVGTVILGRVIGDEINVYDKLKLYPLEKEVLIKSIQINDKNYKSAPFGSRVGLALKGVEIEELKRGFLLCEKEQNVTETLTGNIIKNPFYKDDLKVGINLQIVHGLQNVSCVLEENVLKLNNKIWINKELYPLVLVDNSKKLKFVGLIN